MNTTEIIERIEALAERMGAATEGNEGFFSAWPKWASALSASQLADIATYFGSEVKVSGDKFTTRIKRNGVNVYVETDYGTANVKLPTADLLNAAIAKETSAAA